MLYLLVTLLLQPAVGKEASLLQNGHSLSTNVEGKGQLSFVNEEKWGPQVHRRNKEYQEKHTQDSVKGSYGAHLITDKQKKKTVDMGKDDWMTTAGACRHVEATQHDQRRMEAHTKRSDDPYIGFVDIMIHARVDYAIYVAGYMATQWGKGSPHSKKNTRATTCLKPAMDPREKATDWNQSPEMLNKKGFHSKLGGVKKTPRECENLEGDRHQSPEGYGATPTHEGKGGPPFAQRGGLPPANVRGTAEHAVLRGKDGRGGGTLGHPPRHSQGVRHLDDRVHRASAPRAQPGRVRHPVRRFPARPRVGHELPTQKGDPRQGDLREGVGGGEPGQAKTMARRAPQQRPSPSRAGGEDAAA